RSLARVAVSHAALSPHGQALNPCPELVEGPVLSMAEGLLNRLFTHPRYGKGSQTRRRETDGRSRTAAADAYRRRAGAKPADPRACRARGLAHARGERFG